MCESKTPSEFQKWYASNADDLNARRRKRYAEDPEYRAKVQRWNQQARERARREAEKEQRKVRKAVKMKPATSTWKTVEVEVDGVLTKMFTVGALAKALGKGVSTIRVWERTGVLPETPHRTDKGDRLYTVEMLEAIRTALRKAGKLDTRVLQERRAPVYAVRHVRFGNGEVVRMRLYKVGMLAKALDRSTVALAQMEKRGGLPVTPLRASSIQYRLYTVDMIEAVKKAFDRRGGDLRGDEWRDLYDEIEDEWTRLGVMDAEVVE